MQAATYAIVLISTITHAYWNFVLKRAGGGAAFVGLSKVVEVVAFAPGFVWFLVARPPTLAAALVFVVVGAALVLVNYAALDEAYRHSELSLVYPISRAGSLLFLPFFGYVVFRERLSGVGIASLVTIVAGIAALQLPSVSRGAVTALGPRLRSRGVAFAFVAALAAAAYTIWDKRAVGVLPPFFYFYSYTAIVAAAYLLFLLRRHSAAQLADEWRRRRWPIVQVGVMNTVTYMLVLFALRGGTSSYVIAVRQLSIVWGVLLGHWLLGEGLGAPKRIGVGLLVAGCALVAVSR